jgi:BirA family transcriptional regulator, biotin operon repressor / biotin---[acetyl-CoA-carboxylase] ligase
MLANSFALEGDSARVPAPWRLRTHVELASTNDAARALAEAGEERVAVIAEAQTAGRGRHGRVWRSPPGGLYLSAVARPRMPAERAGLVPIAAGLGVADLLEQLGARPELRWPNDVFLAGRKVAGVLCESRVVVGGAGLAWVVIGVGMNVRTPLEMLAGVPGTSLAAALGGAPPPIALAEPLLAAFDRTLGLAERDPDALTLSWSKHAPMMGKSVLVTTIDGLRPGTAERVGPTGALHVRMPGGVLELSDPAALRVQLAGDRPTS